MMEGTYEGIEGTNVKIGKESLPASEQVIKYARMLETGKNVKATMKDGVVSFLAYSQTEKIAVPVAPSAVPVQQKVQGVTLGMAINNANQYVCVNHVDLNAVDWAEKVAEYTNELLKQMQGRGWL